MSTKSDAPASWDNEKLPCVKRAIKGVEAVVGLIITDLQGNTLCVIHNYLSSGKKA